MPTPQFGGKPPKQPTNHDHPSKVAVDIEAQGQKSEGVSLSEMLIAGEESIVKESMKSFSKEWIDSHHVAGSWGHKKAKPTPAPTEDRIQLVRVGADIEEFLRDSSGSPMTAIGLIGGTKDKPLPILEHLGKGYALQEDNVALEYNIPAAADKHAFIYSLMRIREEIVDRVSKYKLTPAIEASMRFDMKQLDSEQARTFGCDPDFNVWEQKVNEKPEVGTENKNLRTAGGHVHISFLVDKKKPVLPPEGADDLEILEAIVMGMDIFVGVPMSLMDNDKDRMKLYGKAGAFRPKPEYGGVEYRVLSNFWTRSPELMAYVYDGVKKTINYVNAYTDARSQFIKYREWVEPAINDGDKGCAHKVMANFGLQLPSNQKY